MARFLYRLGGASAKHRLKTIFIWVGVLVALIVGAATLSGKAANTFNIPGQESTTAFEILGEKFGAATTSASAQIVLQATDGQTLTTGENTAKVEAAITQLKGLPGALNVSDPFDAVAPTISPDQTTALTTVTYGVQATELTEEEHLALTTIVDTLRDNSGLTVEASGSATEETGVGASPAEAIGVLVALLVLLLTYGSLSMAGMNLITALVGVGIGVAGITTLGGFTELQSTTPILATMLGLAVGIDYALFIVTRYRQELREGKDVREAISYAVGTAGSAVVTAGLTVVIALAGLFVAGIPFLTEMGLAAAGTVVIAVLIAITLVPAALSFIGLRALPKKERKTREVRPERGFFRGWATAVTKGRWIAAPLAIALLAVISIPFFSLETSLSVRPPDDSTQARADQIISSKFGPGVEGPLLVLVDGEGAPTRAATIASEATLLQGIAAANVTQVTPDNSAALVSVIPATGPTDSATNELVKSLRAQIAEGSGPRAYVTGETAISVDVSQKLSDALPVYLVLVVGLALILLILVFRSILVPLVGVLGFLLTIGASLGATVAVFQWGWARDILQPDSLGPIMSLTPIIMVGILFGLAMDYQVFLVSRMHEAHAHGAKNIDAITSGFRSAAPVVVAAAAIMFAVFAGFITDSNAIIKSIGFALAFGILCDAIIVRMVLMPAAIAIMGKASWAFPKWLEWLPHLDIEGEALQKHNKPVV